MTKDDLLIIELKEAFEKIEGKKNNSEENIAQK